MINYKAKIAYCHKIKDKNRNIMQTAGEGKTDIKGAVINSNSDNLTIDTNDLTHSNIQDTYYTETKGSNFSTTIGSDPDKGKTNIAPMGSTTIGFKDMGSEKEQETRATIGNGNIIVKDTINNQTIIVNEDGTTNTNSLLMELNRDASKSQEITKDMITGALDGSMTIDNRWFTKEGRESMGSDFKNFIPNTLNATIGALNATSIILEKTLPSAPQTKFIQNEDGTYTVEPIFPKGLLGTALKYTAFVWNSPNTAIGLTAGALGTLGGAEFGKFDWNNLVFSVNNYPVGGGAITLGNVVIYSGGNNYNSPWSSYDNTKNTILGPHEYGHVGQSYILGPLYLPVYLLSGGVGHWNWMEKQADKKGNEAWKNKYGVKK